MGGIIKFPNGKFWGMAGWVYRAALDGICEALSESPDTSGLLLELKDETDAARTIQFIDIKDWSPDKRIQFYSAIKNTTRFFQERGPIGWHDASFFPAFLRTMLELQGMVEESEGEAAE